ncbi:hypothetical protein BCR35DRAFT_355367 [Leucosporidium creatinivorum]|uniref:NmrA-like domain-containing protein n=1 Tax=Leucosporidium creatinivorum TaxID=106004 RepID=A0A1Y2DHE4_9BASI|nr:hypothetical protein BCR35DRAFT_355367 [Leucosporidium creatinivorum]
MSHYTSFALAGAGGLGSFVAQHLAAVPGVSLRVLSRSNETKIPEGAELKVIDYDSKESLAEALKGVEVVISTLNGAGFAAQPALAKAAIKAGGVKLFVPSEFGNATAQYTDGPLFGKTQFQQLLKSIGLDYLLVHNGPFLDTTFNSFLGFDWENNQVNILGSGTNPIPFTTQNDVARFLAHILTTATPSTLANKTLKIQADTISFLSAVSLFEETHPGRKIEVTHTSHEEAKEFIEKHEGLESLLAWLKLSWDLETAPREEETDNALWREWNPTKAREVIAAL